MGWYWQETTEEMSQRPVPLSLWPSRIWHGMNRAGTWTEAVRSGRITACQPARTSGIRQRKYYVKTEFLSYREYGTDQPKDQPVNARKIMVIYCVNHKKIHCGGKTQDFVILRQLVGNTPVNEP